MTPRAELQPDFSKICLCSRQQVGQAGKKTSAQPRVGTVERLDTTLGAGGCAAPCVRVLKQGLGFPWPCKMVGWEVLERKLVARRASAEAQVTLPAPSAQVWVFSFFTFAVGSVKCAVLKLSSACGGEDKSV